MDTASYWRRVATGQGGPRPSVRRAARTRSDEAAVAAVADRLSVALQERGSVLRSTEQARKLLRTASAPLAKEGRPQTAEAASPLPPSLPAPRPSPAPVPRVSPHFSEADAVADFATMLSQAGLRLSGPPEMDGRMRRVAVEGDRRGRKSGAYVGHLDGWPAGYIRNHKTGEELRWKADRPMRPMTEAERATLTADAAAKSAERMRERLRIQDRAARMAQRMWAAAVPVTAHPYLAAKGVQSHGLRQDRHGRLLVPVQGADGQLWGVQRVGVDGSKLFLKGARTEGGHMLIGGSPEPGSPLLVAEGYATGATLHEATGLPVAVTFNAGNLAAVAKAYRAADRSRPIIIAGDNDHHLPHRPVPLPNVGQEKAEAAAAAVGGAVVLPSFPPGDRGSDWNDFARHDGHAPVVVAVRQAVDRLQKNVTLQAEQAEVAMRGQQAPEARQRGPRL